MADTCGAVRDFYPEQPGRILATCARKPHRSGKHYQYDQDGNVELEFWGEGPAGDAEQEST